LIYINEGKEKVFQEFEDLAIPLMKKYDGELIYRIRPTEDSFINGEKDIPYEIHIISFDTQEKLGEFMADDSRLKFLHLKEEALKSTLVIKGQKM
jgi:uncharacterized protein (DUF1330 family)